MYIPVKEWRGKPHTHLLRNTNKDGGESEGQSEFMNTYTNLMRSTTRVTHRHCYPSTETGTGSEPQPTLVRIPLGHRADRAGMETAREGHVLQTPCGHTRKAAEDGPRGGPLHPWETWKQFQAPSFPPHSGHHSLWEVNQCMECLSLQLSFQ